MRGVLEGQRVAGEQAERGGRDVGHDGHDDVGPTPQRRRHRGEQVALPGLDPVGPGAGDRPAVAVGRHDPRRRSRRPEGGGDGARPRAQVDGPAVGGEAGAGPPGQLQALPAGDVDPGVDDDGLFAEVGPAGDPGQGLAGQAPVDQRLQQGQVVAGAGDQVPGLLLGRDAAGSGQLCGQLGQEAIGSRRQSIIAPVIGRPGPAVRVPTVGTVATAVSGRTRARRRGWAGTGSG